MKRYSCNFINKLKEKINENFMLENSLIHIKHDYDCFYISTSQKGSLSTIWTGFKNTINDTHMIYRFLEYGMVDMSMFGLWICQSRALFFFYLIQVPFKLQNLVYSCPFSWNENVTCQTIKEKKNKRLRKDQNT